MHLRFRLRTIMHTPRPTGDRGDMTGDDKESFKVRPRLAALHPTSQARTWRLALERRAASAHWQWGSGQWPRVPLRSAVRTRHPLSSRGKRVRAQPPCITFSLTVFSLMRVVLPKTVRHSAMCGTQRAIGRAPRLHGSG